MRTMHTHRNEEVRQLAAVALWRIQRSKLALSYLRPTLRWSRSRQAAVALFKEAGRDADFASLDLLKSGCVEAAVDVVSDRRLLTQPLVDSLGDEDASWSVEAERLLLELMLEEDELWRFAVRDYFFN